MEEEINVYYGGLAYPDSELQKMVDDIFEQVKETNDCVLEYRNINGNIKYFLNGVECTKEEYDTQAKKIAPSVIKLYSGGPYITQPYMYLSNDNNNILC